MLSWMRGLGTGMRAFATDDSGSFLRLTAAYGYKPVVPSVRAVSGQAKTEYWFCPSWMATWPFSMKLATGGCGWGIARAGVGQVAPVAEPGSNIVWLTLHLTLPRARRNARRFQGNVDG